MKTLHAIAFSLLASLSMATAADLPSPLLPLPREQPQWWRQQYEQQVEQVKNNPCGVLFLGDHQPDLPHHGFRHTGPDGTQTLHRHDRHQ